MKKEDAYRDKSGCYVAFEYDGHVFVLVLKTKAGKGESLSFTFCLITSSTEFAARFTTAEEAIAAVHKIGLDVVYTQDWQVLENKDFNTFFEYVDKLKWREWHEYQEAQQHKAPFAAIAVGNRVYKDTYSTALSYGGAWVFYDDVERLIKYPVQATHKIDLLLIAVRELPDMKLFDTKEERTEWSLKYLEEYAAIPEPAEEVQKVVPVGMVNAPKNSCIVNAFESQGTPKLRPVELPPGSVIEVDSYKSAEIHMRSDADNTTPWAASPYILKASSDALPVVETHGIKAMKSGVTPQPSRSRIGKIAARPYEYVYDGPEQMGTTFVSRYRIDDEVWTRIGHELVKMKVTGIYVEHEEGSTAYSYFLNHPTLTIGARAENECYDTLFDLISAMTRISVEDLIAAAKEVV